MEECQICQFLETDEGESLKRTIQECMDFLSNGGTSQLLTLLIGSKITYADVLNHKKHSHSLDLYSQETTDVNSLESLNKSFAIDALHGIRLNPGSTGSNAGLQALKNLEKLSEKDKENKDNSGDLWIEFAEWVENSDLTREDKAKIADEIRILNDRESNRD